MIVMLLKNVQNVQKDIILYQEYVKLAQQSIIALNVQKPSRVALYVMQTTMFQKVNVKNALLYHIAQHV